MFVLKGVASHILQNAILVLLVDNAHAHCIALCLFDIFVITDRQRFIKKRIEENPGHPAIELEREMPPRKRKASHQALEKQVAAKRQGRVQPADVPASTTPELETTRSDPANSMAVTTQQDRGTVVPPPVLWLAVYHFFYVRKR